MSNTFVNTLQWRHNGCDSASNHQPHYCFLNRLFRHRSKKTFFPAQIASNAENVSIPWGHHIPRDITMLNVIQNNFEPKNSLLASASHLVYAPSPRDGATLASNYTTASMLVIHVRYSQHMLSKWHQTDIPLCNQSFHNIMTSSNGNIFRVTDPSCGEVTGHRWIPLPKASDAELWCFLWFAPE